MSDIPPQTDLDERAGWDQLAEFYYEFRSEGGKFNHKDRARIGESGYVKGLMARVSLQGKSVLDAGCGFGYYAFIAADLGATVTAIDFAPEMIEKARRLATERELPIDFQVGDVTHMPHLADSTFDLVVSGMDLEIPDVRVAFKEFARVLKKQGRLVFSVPHPVVQHGSWHKNEAGEKDYLQVAEYFERGSYIAEWLDENQRPIRFKRYRRTIQDYVQALAEIGFVVTRLFEGEPPAECRVSDPELYKDLYTAPTYLIVEAESR